MVAVHSPMRHGTRFVIGAALAALATLSAPAHADGASPAPGKASVAIKPEMLQFEFEANPETLPIPCKAALVDPLSQDWSVKCGEGKDVAVFRVHLWLTVYTSTRAPKQRYELLYWVTGDSSSVAKGLHGDQTTWFNMNEPGSLHSIETRVALDEIASLRLALTMQ